MAASTIHYYQLPAGTPLAVRGLPAEQCTLGLWEGGLGWCGGLLGPRGFLATEFNCASERRGLEKLLADCGAPVLTEQCAPLTRIDEQARQLFGQLQRGLENLAAGRRDAMEVPLDYSLGTAFQQQVWKELRRVPWGEAISYGELAARIGNPKASRAVGSANGKNPLAPVVPCHRVIQSGGALGGYGGGLEMKRRLLALEGVAVR
jgi:O-6-methylguanine DNA methyltransferase